MNKCKNRRFVNECDYIDTVCCNRRPPHPPNKRPDLGFVECVCKSKEGNCVKIRKEHCGPTCLSVDLTIPNCCNPCNVCSKCGNPFDRCTCHHNRCPRCGNERERCTCRPPLCSKCGNPFDRCTCRPPICPHCKHPFDKCRCR